MPLFFLDTSALVKIYIQEPGSPAMQRLARAAAAELAISSLGWIEFRSALRARQRHGDIAENVADAALDHFRRTAASLWRRQILTDSVFETAAVLVDRSTLRALDALQLAACIVFQQQMQAGPDAGVAPFARRAK